MSVHTPGPWGFGNTCHDDQKLILGKGGKGKYICTVQIHQTPRSFGTHEEPEREANALLITAAPELLEALSKAVREAEQFLFDAWLVRVRPSGDVESVQRQWLASSDHREFVDEWREQIDAIAKATGST